MKRGKHQDESWKIKGFGYKELRESLAILAKNYEYAARPYNMVKFQKIRE